MQVKGRPVKVYTRFGYGTVDSQNAFPVRKVKKTILVDVKRLKKKEDKTEELKKIEEVKEDVPKEGEEQKEVKEGEEKKVEGGEK